MNTLDYAIIGLATYLTILGLYRGLIKELFSILALVFGLIVAYLLGDILYNYLSHIIETDHFVRPIALLVLFMFTVLIINYIGKLLSSFFRYMALGWLNRILGGVFGLLKAFLILLALMYLYNLLSPLLNSDLNIVTNSCIIVYIDQVLSVVKAHFPL